MKILITLLTFCIFLITIITMISAQDLEIGYNDPTLPKVVLEIPETPINYSLIPTVNSSEYWDGLDTINSTQMENSGGVLNILESYLTSFFNALFSTKTTDDLSEGTTNLYDNQSWNETKLDLVDIDSFEENISVTVSGGEGFNVSSSLDFLITQITVTPTTASNHYRFEAIESGTGDVIDRDRTFHTGTWDIIKAYSIDNSVVVNITEASIDEDFNVRIKYVDNYLE